MGKVWTDEELITLVYFASRTLVLPGVSFLIAQKFGAARPIDYMSKMLRKINAQQLEESGSRMYTLERSHFITWYPQVTDDWLVKRIEACAKKLAWEKDKDVGKAPQYYAEVKAKCTGFGSEENAKAHFMQETLDLINANPIKFPDSMAAAIKAYPYSGESVRRTTPTPGPKTETDQSSGEPARQKTPSPGPETETDQDIGELAPQNIPSPGPETQTDQTSREPAVPADWQLLPRDGVGKKWLLRMPPQPDLEYDLE